MGVPTTLAEKGAFPVHIPVPGARTHYATKRAAAPGSGCGVHRETRDRPALVSRRPKSAHTAGGTPHPRLPPYAACFRPAALLGLWQQKSSGVGASPRGPLRRRPGSRGPRRPTADARKARAPAARSTFSGARHRPQGSPECRLTRGGGRDHRGENTQVDLQSVPAGAPSRRSWGGSGAKRNSAGQT